MAVTQQMRNDWGNFWSDANKGAVQSWGNGTLTRNTDGSATYKSNSGGTTNFNAGMSIEDFDKSSPEIGNILKNNYGYSATPQTPAFSPISVTSPSAVTGAVTDDMTVEKRLNRLLSSDSPLLQQARAKAMQTANSRGLLNSSLAAGAGEEAAISQALPIATTDANTFFQQARANQEAQNAANIAAANAANNAAIARSGYDAQAKLAELSNTAASSRLEQQAQYDASLLDKKLAVENSSRSSDNLWKFGADYINKSLSTQSWMTDKIATIQGSNLSPEDKQAAIDGTQALAANMQTSMNAVYSKIPGWKQEWVSVATGADVGLSSLPAAQSVVNNYWASGKAGDSGAWGDGKITHNGDGTATYTTKDGRNVALSQGMGLSDLAATDAEVRANLKSLYGYGG